MYVLLRNPLPRPPGQVVIPENELNNSGLISWAQSTEGRQVFKGKGAEVVGYLATRGTS